MSACGERQSAKPAANSAAYGYNVVVVMLNGATGLKVKTLQILKQSLINRGYNNIPVAG